MEEILTSRFFQYTKNTFIPKDGYKCIFILNNVRYFVEFENNKFKILKKSNKENIIDQYKELFPEFNFNIEKNKCKKLSFLKDENEISILLINDECIELGFNTYEILIDILEDN